MSKQIVDNDGVVTKLFGGPVPLKPRAAQETYSCCGSPTIIRTDLYFDDKGHKKAKQGQVLDLDGMIQAALPSTDIAAIVARYKMGDESVLNVNPGFIGDSVNIPKDLYDYKAMNDLYDKVSGSFSKLPAEVQALFGNDANTYLNSIISNKAEEILKNYEASKKPTEEVKDNA